jgi:hypothetical protein
MADLTMKDLGGVMAGSLIASCLLDTLIAKGVISRDDARQTIVNARGLLGSEAVGPLDTNAAEILDWMLKNRFADRGNE